MTAFATSNDLEARLRVEFTATQDIQAATLLESVSNSIRAAADQIIDEVADEEVTLDGNGRSILPLPEFPVTAITSVTVDGDALTADDDYLWAPDGLLYRATDGVWSRCVTWGGQPQSIVVVYTHGYPAVPDDLRDLTVEIAARAWTNPRSLLSEQIGSWSGRWQTATTGVTILDHEQVIVSRYRRPVLA